jgi:ATP-binding cassette subfamily F protein 3
MLQVQGLEYRVGDRILLNGIDWAIQPARRAALIGPNGAGKTTMFRLMIGKLTPNQGRIVKPKNYRIGLLPQEELDVSGGTILDAVLEGRPDALALERKIQALHEALNRDPENEELLAQLGELERSYAAGRGYELETVSKTLLSGLGFPESDFQRPLEEFSGGWRMRAYLARLLLQEPDLLLLDEPTNHLDLPAIEWLEQYLLDFEGSIVLVSHDRYFIDRLSHEIYELDRGILTFYPGNYHTFETKKREQELLLLKRWEEQQAEIKRQERFIERFRAKNTKATQVQSRIKHLAKLERIERPPERRRLGFELDPGEKSFKDVLEIREMGFAYDEDWVLRRLNLHVLRGEKLALVGPNGAGKTTLARLIAGQLTPREGDLILGQRARIGYYAQHQVAALNVEASILEEVNSTVAEAYVPKVREALAVFQFSGDDINKKIKVLSGGEKARVSLAKILLSPVNFLVMDEPTNHLDLMSREALEEALGLYEGTLLLVSHDRYFLDKLVHRVIELQRGGRFEEYAGNYSYYLEKREQAPPPEALREFQPESRPKTRLFPGRKSKEQKRREAEARQRISKDRNRLESEILWLEKEIDRLEKRKKEIEGHFCRPDAYHDREYAVALQKELGEANRRLHGFYEDWERKKIALEELLEELERILADETGED